MLCFITGSSKSDYLLNKSYLNNKITIHSDYAYWINEKTTKFNYGLTQKGGTNLDYNRDFPHDYSSNLLGSTLNNESFAPCNFIITIYGACNSPYITISGHTYGINADIAANEFITVNSIDKTIIKTGADGKKTNCFNLRYKDSYIFEKIPSGQLNVSSNTFFKFDITVLDERSEPKWI